MNAPTLARKAFSVSRLAEFASVTELLAEAYAAMTRGAAAKAALRHELERLTGEAVETPPDLLERVHAYLAAHPSSSWATAVEAVAGAA